MKRNLIIIALFYTTNILLGQTIIHAGEVSGYWGKENSPYRIMGHINIPADNTLEIEPGVVVEFYGYYELEVRGRLLAVGNKKDSIVFTNWKKLPLIEHNWESFEGWHGIRFENVNPDADSSKILYAVIEYSGARWKPDQDPHMTGKDNHGGGIYVQVFSKLLIANCRITNNFAYYGGGGITCLGASPEIRGNKIFNNSADTGGGLSLNQSQSIVINNCIYNNSSNSYGGGIYIINTASDSPNLLNNTICNNSANHYDYPQGNAIACWGSNATFYNCIIRGNKGKGEEQIYLRDNSHPNFINCNIENLDNGIISPGESYNNQLIDCIDEEPLFIEPSESSGYLSYEVRESSWNLGNHSPCIDNGSLIADSIYSISTDIIGKPRISNGKIDIGAYEVQLSSENFNSFMNEEINIYPNPIHSEEILRVRTNMHIVSLEIFDIWGRLLISTGTKELDTSLIPAGTYFVKINFDCEGCDEIKKLIKID